MSVKYWWMFRTFLFTNLFLKQVTPSDQYIDPHCERKQVIVQLFEWRFVDIADECERFLGDKDFCGVQVSPITEHRVIKPYRPWFERYQPVSYKIHSRSGNEAEFKDMVERCNNVGVRIYVDVVLNHMTEVGVSGTGVAGSTFDSRNLTFPGVPYNRTHFHNQSSCPHNGHTDFSQPEQVRECNRDSHKLADLDQSLLYVRNKIADFLNHLIDLGVAGFRMDSSKFMNPGDILAIQDLTKDLPEGGRPFFINSLKDLGQDAIKGNEYYNNGMVTDFKYSRTLASAIWDLSTSNSSFFPSLVNLNSSHALVFVDNHETQRDDISNVVTHNSMRTYKMASALMLANDYGFARVMSSYKFGYDLFRGPPEYSNHTIREPITDVHNQGTCGNGWVCEHRWRPIANMVTFRNEVAGTDKRYIRVTTNEVSFARGSKGFFAMAKNGTMNETLQTGLPAGKYCDLITECKRVITVNSNGEALIQIYNLLEPIVAFIVDGPLAHLNQHKFVHVGNVIGYDNSSLLYSTVRSNAANSTGSWTPSINASLTTPSIFTVNTSSGATGPLNSSITSSATPMLATSVVAGKGSLNTNYTKPVTKPSPVTVRITTQGNPTSTRLTSCQNFTRTIIFVHDRTVNGQDLFIRGGVDKRHRSGCELPNAGNNCSIPIRSNPIGNSSHYYAYNSWSQGDHFLDWYGPEPQQGRFNNRPGQGTPAVWTTNVPSDPRYHPLNTFGDHYWLVDIDMDCCKTINGWFEMKARINYDWERNIFQGIKACDKNEDVPYENVNHWAKCGMMNVYELNAEKCQILPIPKTK